MEKSLVRPADCCREELQQPVFMAIDTLEYPELHDESIPTLAFIKSMNRLLVAAGIDMQESVEHLLEETAGLEELNMRLVITFVLCDTLYFCHSACHSCIKATSPLSTIPN